MTGIATSRNLSMDTAGLIGRASGAGRSTIMDAAAVRAFADTYSISQVDSAIADAVSGIDLSDYLPLTGGTLTGLLTAQSVSIDDGSAFGRIQLTNAAGRTGFIRHFNTDIIQFTAFSGDVTIYKPVSLSSKTLSCGAITTSGKLLLQNSTTAVLAEFSKTYTSSTNREYFNIGFTGTNYDLCSRVGSAGGSNQPIRLGHIAADGTTFAGLVVATSGVVSVSSILTGNTTGGISVGNDANYLNMANVSGYLTIRNVNGGNGIRFMQSGSSGTEWARINSSGRMLIGTTTDDGLSKLQISGAVTVSGAFTPATLTDAAAPNGSIYYSSTASKLVYKDAGGTVNNLY